MQCIVKHKYACEKSTPCPFSDTKFYKDVEWRMYSSPPLKVNEFHTKYISIGAMFPSHDWHDYHLRELFKYNNIPGMCKTLCGELQEAYQRWIEYYKENQKDQAC